LIDIRSDDDVVVASRAALARALAQGADSRRAARIDLVVRELAWNLVRHGGGGILSAQAVEEDGMSGLRIESRDDGRGIASMEHDPDSVGLGLGLALIQRHASEFTLRSSVDRGTRISVVIWWPSTSS
jgi:serine/threonine-protein kinase RsbT